LSNQKNNYWVKAVDAYVNEKRFDIDVRFDIIAIHKESKSFCNWTPNRRILSF
jgi:putative endonuclease